MNKQTKQRIEKNVNQHNVVHLTGSRTGQHMTDTYLINNMII